MIASAAQRGPADGRGPGDRELDGPGPVLAVRGLAKAYGRSRVLDVPDLTIPSGTLTAVVGSNGTGKSTLLACLAGTLVHDGRFTLGGRVVRPSPGRIAYLPQRIRLPGGATVAEVLALFRSVAGPMPDRTTPADGFLPAGQRRIGELSGGQAQRVALAATFLGAPEIVLLDEPLANLDDSGLAAVHAMLAAHREAGATILVTSPVAAFDLLAAADLVVQLDAGRITFQGPAVDFLDELPTTVWVALAADGEAGLLARLDHVERIRIVGSWAALGCRERHVTTLVRALTDRGVVASRIRIAGPAERSPDPAAADGGLEVPA